ncbi:MAG: outer membrane beta-barrel protein [Bacteroidaceae bacterium]|nr:outer membrane beta-barrel protein [Bacteroidaceae bacterium]
MKKLLVLAVALLTVGSISAQITYSIGYLSTSSKAQAKGATSNTETMNGITIGVDDNINLTGDFYVAPGIGIDLSFRKMNGETLKKFGLYVPVDFNYGFNLSSDIKLSVFAGPTFDLGLIYNTKDYDCYKKEEGNMSRFDILLGGGAWLTFQDQYRLQIGYKAGLLNTSKTDNFTVKNNIFSISLGYIF